MLSSKSVERLVATPQADYTRGATRRRSDAREAVKIAAEELGFDPLAPPFPRFAGGEDVLRAAALRVLTVPGLEKELERHRARVAACGAHADAIAELVARRQELERVELGRRHDQVMAGKAPGPSPAEAIAECRAIDDELALLGAADVPGLGLAERVRAWVQADEHPLILEAATPAALPSITFYGALVVERLKVLTEDEPYNSPAATTAQRTAAELANLVKRFNFRTEDEGLYRVLRAVRAAVELADLHLLHERQVASIEQLEAASVG
jgi:hypothetical protein